MKPRVLIGYSCCPITLEAFERAGCEAWTCDILPSRGRQDRHLQCDIWEVAHDNWSAGIFHPMCTYLTISAAWAFGDGPYHQAVKPGTLVGERGALRGMKLLRTSSVLMHSHTPMPLRTQPRLLSARRTASLTRRSSPINSEMMPASALGFGLRGFRAFAPLSGFLDGL